ncbi:MULTISPECIES: hypothetical protein [unclassified Thalassospira]|uniref:hypothetical protein n=1 Tax=unclassified Thalassospira TaxID=2648997 RepID=UPI0007A5C18C|nr:MULTISPECIES: hypothetical protein [unclassified Thalassospira]KZC99719.1 hypothetical protein AUQ41_08565 [Thalassospira sp. MCCC 1A02898]ONH85351.1 hypothetical protein TH47_05770 [Thalassospira sp. MCCC 1A02803]
MTATKPILPLAQVAADPVMPTPANDLLPTGTLTMGMIRQRVTSRRTQMVAVEVKRPRRVHEIDAAEAAFFPRLFWGIYLAFDQDDPENARIASALREDMQTYGDLMNPSQWPDFKREMDSAAMSAMEIRQHRQGQCCRASQTGRCVMRQPKPFWECEYRNDRRKHRHRCFVCRRIINVGQPVVMHLRIGGGPRAAHTECADQNTGIGKRLVWRDLMLVWGLSALLRQGWPVGDQLHEAKQKVGVCGGDHE